MLTTPADFSAFQGGSGTYTTAQVTNALLMAESKMQDWLNTALVPTVATEEFPWPLDDNKAMLKKVRLVSITSVKALHSLDCNCTWQEDTDCAVVLDARMAMLQLIDCNGTMNHCWPCRCPKRVRVTYTYGFTAVETDATTPDGNILRAAIYTAALGFLHSTIGLDACGDVSIPSWSSTGYSESRQFNERSGAEELVNPLIQQAKQMIRHLCVKRLPGQRVRKGTMM